MKERDLNVLFKKLTLELRAFLNGQQQQVDAITEYAKAQQKANEPQPPRKDERVRAEIHFSPEAIDRHYSEQSKSRPAERRTFWVSLLTLLALIIYTLYTIWMYGATRDAADAAKSAAETASAAFAQSKIDAAAQAIIDKAAREESAKQSKAALDASITASRNDQRAWLGVTNFKLSKDPVVNEEASATFAISNTGKTPALNVTSKGLFAMQPSEPSSPIWSSIASANSGVIFPNSVSPDGKAFAYAAQVTPSVVQAYTVRSTTIYVWIRIDYDDVFGRHHWSEVCALHRFGESLTSFPQCKNGGGVDKEAKQ